MLIKVVEPVLSLIIPAVSTRVRSFLPVILDSLEAQIGDDPRVEVLILLDNRRWSIGRKMNELVRMARGQYIAGLGDDDQITDDYVSSILAAIEDNPGVDCITFHHEYWQDGVYKAVVKESKDYNWQNNWDAGLLLRSPDTKMPARSDIVKHFTYPHEWHGEDVEYAKWLRERIQTEYIIDRVLYRYMYRMSTNNEGKHFRKDRKERGFF